MNSIEVRLVNRFKFEQKIQGDHECMLFKATHSQTNESLFLKGEEAKQSKKRNGSFTVLQEGKVYQSMQGGLGIPFMHWCGSEEDFNFVVLDNLGVNIWGLYEKCKRNFSLKTVLMMGIQLCNILQYFHFKNFSYNNINPKNIMIGSGSKCDNFFLTDLSKSIRYKDSQTLEHVKERKELKYQLKNFNLEFSSIDFQEGFQCSRKDDMESLLYLLSYLINGKLPWSDKVHGKLNNQTKLQKVLQMKINENGKNLFPNLPSLQSLYDYTVNLKFSQKPHYAFYLSVFHQLLDKQNLIDDKIYDWMLTDQEQDEFQDVNIKFNVIQNQEEYVKSIEKHLKQSDEFKEEEIFKENVMGKHLKSDKDCAIY